MANWLDKYEQGGLVLKKKTKDNYGKRENANEGRSTAGPGWVGEGTTNRGFNYNGAWGGTMQNGGKMTLTEAIVYGHKDPSTKAYFNKVRAIAERYQDKNFWLTPLASYHALEQMHSKYKAPKINTIGEDDIPYYNPVGDSINIPNPTKDNGGDWSKDVFLSELAHKVQSNKKGNVSFVKDLVGKDLINTLKNVDSSDIFTKKGWLDAYRKNYVTPGTLEHEAHSVIAPKLETEYREIREKQFDRLRGDMAMGGSLPGAVGFTYARVAGSAPANGKYTKKTKASAQNGKEMSFYQNGLDFKPKSISKNGSVIKDDMGQWAHPGEITEIGSNDITMQGVDYPVLGISDTGDTKMMYPDQDYKFDGEKVTEFPIAQGGRNVPTTADSTRLYNSQMALNKFYENEMKAGRIKKDYASDFYGIIDEDLRKENLDFYRTLIKRRSNKLYTFDDLYKKIFNLSPEQVSKLENKGLGQTKSGSEYQEYYRDLITPMQNLASPFALIDKRIAPQRRISYSPKSSDYPGGNVDVYDYDPILIKPVNMLTPEERALRIKKYGKNSGIKETVSKPIQKSVSKPEPKPELAPVVAKQPTPQPKPLYEYEGEQVMAPVPSGGGSAIVGVKKKDGTIEYIKPEDYQRMGVPKYGQDYIKSKQKMQDGGWLDKYQDGGNINKKLKEEAEERLARMNTPKATISQYTPEPGEQAKFDKQKLERIAEDNTPLNRMAASKGARNIQDAALFALDVMTLGEAAAFTKPALKAAAKYATEKTALKNAYKLNPLAFKANPEAYYRMVGKAGYADALESGVVRPPIGSGHTEAYYNKGYPLDTRLRDVTGRAGYEGPYMAEVKGNKELFVDENVAGYTGPMFEDPVVYSKEPISISNPSVKLYKENWLKGYKEIPKKEGGGWLNKYK